MVWKNEVDLCEEEPFSYWEMTKVFNSSLFYFIVVKDSQYSLHERRASWMKNFTFPPHCLLLILDYALIGKEIRKKKRKKNVLFIIMVKNCFRKKGLRCCRY